MKRELYLYLFLTKDVLMIAYFVIKKITGVSTDVTSEDARNIIEECLETIDKDADVEIAFLVVALLL